MQQDHECELRVAADHPSLPGHFPGRPIVPGVLLLDRVLGAAGDWLGHPLCVAELAQAKFTAPLLPEQPARVQLKLDGGTLRFTVTRVAERAAEAAPAAGTPDPAAIIAQGLFKLRPGSGA